MTTTRAAGFPKRMYYYFIMGGFGGLNGWFLIALLTRRATMRVPLEGFVLGALIGLGAGSYDGLAARSAIRVLKFGLTSALCGAVGGALALSISQMLYSAVLTHNANGTFSAGLLRFVIGVICWSLFGALLGLAEGMAKGSQAWKGLCGGMAGGFIGGCFYEAFGRTTGGATGRAQLLLALTVVVLGAFIALSIALVTMLLKGAWFTVLDGKRAGSEIDISKYVHPDLGGRRPGIVGSSQWESNVYLPGDGEVLPKHAILHYTDGAPTVSALPDALHGRKTTKVNGRAITSWPLRNGDRVQIGSTNLQYWQKR